MERNPRGTSGVLERLEACDPVRRAALVSDRIELALDEMGAAIAGRRASAARPRYTLGRRRALVVVVALLAIGTGAAAAAGVFSARTGLYPTKTEEAMGGPGEALNPAAPDFRSVALQVASDIRYPKGYESWRDWLLDTQLPSADEPASSQGLVSTGALHGWFAASAFCAWVQSWRQAAVAGDANAAALAAQTVAQAPSWKAVTDEDPHPDPSAANDPGAETGTLFGWILPYRDAVLAGDRGRVDHLLASGYGGGKCWISDPAWMARERAHARTWGTLSPRGLAREYGHFLANGGS